MSTGPGTDPEFNDVPPKTTSGPRYTLLRGLLVVAAIGLLIALLLPAVRSGAGPAARRSQCTNNLKQIMLAMHNYAEVHKAFPPAYTVDANGRPLHSWRTLILPYLEMGSLASVYETIDLSKPWDDPANAAAARTRVVALICPEFADAKNRTTYLANVGPDGFLVPGRPRRPEEITDGLSSTLAVIDAGDEEAVPWMAPFDAGAAGLRKLDAKAELHHAGGTNAAIADGSVRFLEADTTAAMRRALLSASGNDNAAITGW